MQTASRPSPNVNPFLQSMGFGPKDRVLILHIDDMGFSHAANIATRECLTRGSATCASVLVNAPWFQEAASICAENPELDVGVHLTLTAEYPAYRWPALSSRDPATGLLDDQGYLYVSRPGISIQVAVLSGFESEYCIVSCALAREGLTP